MTTIQLSPSLLNEFYNYSIGRYRITTDRLVDSINKVRQPSTPAQQRGQDFELSVMNRLPFESVPTEVMELFYKETENAIWQHEIKYNIQIYNYNVVFKGFTDCLFSDIVKDIKTTGKYEKGKYAGNFQTPIYLLATGLTQIDYMATDFKNFYKESYYLNENMHMAVCKWTIKLINWMQEHSEFIDWSKRVTEINTKTITQ